MRYPSAANLRVHVSCVHEQNRPYKCDECPQGFRSKIDLKGHLKSRHNYIIPHEFKCDLCPKVFPRSSALRLHKLRQHEKTRVYSCTYCPDITFRTAYLLKSHHLRTHPVRY